MGISEDLLKELILSKYKSIREFTTHLEMPYSTLDSIFKRGIRKASVDNIIKICDSLGISADALVDGRIEAKSDQPATIAAHKDGDNFTPDELAKIEEYKKLLLAARPKEFLNAAHSNGATPDQSAAADAIMKDDDEWK